MIHLVEWWEVYGRGKQIRGPEAKLFWLVSETAESSRWLDASLLEVNGGEEVVESNPSPYMA